MTIYLLISNSSSDFYDFLLSNYFSLWQAIFITDDFGSSEFVSSKGRFESLETATSGTTDRVDGESKTAVIPSTSTVSSINIPSPPAASTFSFGTFRGHGRSNNRYVYMIKPVCL